MAKLSADLHPKLTNSVLLCFASKNIYTVFDFVSEDSEKIMQYSDLTYQEILDLKEKIMRLYIGRIRKGCELLKINYQNVIKTEIISLDNLLKGGLNGGEIYEICGISASGKSQLCHTLAVNIGKKLNRIVHYVDTKGDFCAKRILTIMKSKKLNEAEQELVLNNTMVTKIGKPDELMNLLHNIIKNKTNKSIKLLIIDSLPALFFNCEKDSVQYLHTSYLNHFANILRCVANELNIPVITINLISEWRGSIFAINGSEPSLIRKPNLGKYWFSIPNTRLYIETMQREKRKISVWKSSRLSSNSNCLVEITNSGII